MEIHEIVISKTAEKQLRKLPSYIVLKLQAWVESVNHQGLSEIRKIPGFHDEPLRGKRAGQRSIRLSKAYRAIYIIDKDGNTELVEILEVNKHDYS